jgi:hypothetical protein
VRHDIKAGPLVEAGVGDRPDLSAPYLDEFATIPARTSSDGAYRVADHEYAKT